MKLNSKHLTYFLTIASSIVFLVLVFVVVFRSELGGASELFTYLANTAAILLFAATLCAIWLLFRKDESIRTFRDSIKPLISGDYTHRLEVPEDNEFRKLAKQLNELVEQLDESLQTRQSMSDIDRLILSGAKLSAIIHRSLIAGQLDAIETGLLLRPDLSSVQVVHHRLDGQRVATNIVSQFDMSEDALRDIEKYREMLAGLIDNSMLDVSPVACGDRLIGVFYAAGNRPLTGGESKRISDLVDRLSVAITNLDRSESLYQQAHFDSLTGLVNRRAFEEQLKGCLLKLHHGEEGVVLFMDLNGFKKVNDTQGHEAGDQLLIGVAERLRETLRPEDTVARLGGDEFGIIAAGRSDQKFVVSLCQRIIDSITKPIMVGRLEHSVGASVGVALYPKDGQTLDELVTKADSAMYRAKESSGSGYAFFDDSLRAANKHRITLERHLRSAIDNRILQTHFQPKLNVKTQAIDSAEALLRWNDAKLGNIEPKEFIAIAEETGLIHDLLPPIVEGIASLLKKVSAKNLAIKNVALNTSPRQLMQEGFALSLLSQLDSFRVPHDKVEVEVTETVFANDLARVLSEVHILRMAGIRVALDDFGTGFSSLNMLRELPLDVVKIDRSFIKELESSKQARDMVTHLIDIAASLGLEVVAEGVETKDQLEHLVSNGCHHIQGFIIARAMSEENFVEFIGQWRPPKAAPRVIDLAVDQRVLGSA